MAYNFVQFFLDLYHHGFVTQDGEGFIACFYCEMPVLPSIEMVHAADCLYVELQEILAPILAMEATKARHAAEYAELTRIAHEAQQHPKGSKGFRALSQRYADRLKFMIRQYERERNPS